MNIFTRKWVVATVLFAAQASLAQNSLLINPGAELFIGDSAFIVLQNMDFENNGVVTETVKSRLGFTGNLPVSLIGGSSITSFGKLEVNRGAGIIRLANSINVNKFAVSDNRGKYYRLKMVDKDGKFSYSNIVAIDCSGTRPVFNVYPNPCTDKITIQLPIANHNSTLTIRDISGKTIYQQTIKPRNSRFTFNVTALANGMYLLEWQSNTLNYTTKFIKH